MTAQSGKAGGGRKAATSARTGRSAAHAAPKSATESAPEGRKKSLLSRTGDDAKAAAERALLLKTLKAKGWNLTHTAEALEMPGPSQVLRAIDTLGLRAEYEAARAE